MSKHAASQVEDMIATEDDAVVSEMLRAYATLLTEKEDNGITHWNGTTHYAGCIQAGPKHYECALQEVGRLRGTIMDLRVKLEAADNRNTRNYYADGYEAGYQTCMAEKKPWVGLTDDEIEHLRNDQPWWMVRNIEARLKDKNT
jgi:hypothetical protein